MIHVAQCSCSTQPWKEGNYAICSNMDKSRDYNTKWYVRKKILYHLYVESEKMMQMNLLKKKTNK